MFFLHGAQNVYVLITFHKTRTVLAQNAIRLLANYLPPIHWFTTGITIKHIIVLYAYQAHIKAATDIAVIALTFTILGRENRFRDF